MIRAGVVRLIAFDEAHKPPMDGRYFREEFALLKGNLTKHMPLSPTPIAGLAATATFTAKLKERFETMYSIEFVHCIWGDMSRARDFELNQYIGRKVAEALKTGAKRHLGDDSTKAMCIKRAPRVPTS